VRWRTAVVAEPDTDQRRWELTASAVSEGGQVSLRGLPPLVVIEVLFGVQQRVLGGAKVKDVILRAVCDTLRRQQAPTVEDVFGPPTGVDADLRRGPAPADVADARSTLCAKHSRRFRRRPRRSLEQFLTDPGVRPLPALGPCRVAACTRTAESGGLRAPYAKVWVRRRQMLTPATIGASSTTAVSAAGPTTDAVATVCATSCTLAPVQTPNSTSDNPSGC
jgi:hypothetical protein